MIDPSAPVMSVVPYVGSYTISRGHPAALSVVNACWYMRRTAFWSTGHRYGSLTGSIAATAPSAAYRAASIRRYPSASRWMTVTLSPPPAFAHAG
jgi:hypothetical protein